MKSDRQTLEALERELGRHLEPGLEGSIAHLNEVPTELVSEVRTLGNPVLARQMLAYYTTAACHPYLDLYVQDVAFGRTPPESWMRGRVLVPDFGLEDQLCADWAALIAPIGRTFAVRIVPELKDWIADVPWVGAPACPQPDADYRSEVPTGTVSLADPKIEHVTDTVVAVRRWIATRLAADLDRRGRLDVVQDLTEVASTLPPLQRWSEDARVAAWALLRERRELERKPDEIPGFRGADTWYRETSAGS